MSHSEPSDFRFADHLFTAGDLLAVLDAVGDGITVQAQNGALIYANPAAARALGFDSPEQLVRTPSPDIMSHFRMFDEYGVPLSRDDLPGRRVLHGEGSQQQLVRYRIKGRAEDGWSLVHSEPVLDRSGHIRFVINIWHDMTESMQRQRALEENAAQVEEVSAELEATVEELQERTAEAIDAKARAEYTAERHRFLAEAGRLLSSSLDPEATLRSIVQLAVPRLADWCTISLVDKHGELQQLEVAHADPEKLQWALELQKRYPPNPDDSWRVIRSGKSELYREIPPELLEKSARDEEHLRIIRELNLHSAMVVPLIIRDRVLGIITFIRSGSSESYAEDDLEFAESLAARSALALANARLYSEAEQANRAKSDFLAIMSHELRTPLTAIFGYTELLATGISGPVTDAQTTQLERIRSSAAHLLGIIEDILSFARAEAGREELREERVHLSGVIAEAFALVQPAAAQKHITLTQAVRRDVVLSTDRGKVRQILVNLLGNAVKFTDQGRVEVIGDFNGVNVTIAVKDTGIGIAPEDIQRVFEPFRQLQSATTRTVGGTGLGLAVSRRFAELLGGTLTVESTPGEGSTFTLTVPPELPA